MRKIFVSFVITLLILTIGTKAFATRFESLAMNVDLPEDYYNLKAGIDTNDSKIEYYTAMMQTTKEALKAEYEKNSTLYNGISSNLSKEIYITEITNKLTESIYHLSLANDEQFDKVKEELASIGKEQGLSTTTQEVYKLGGVTFIHSIMKSSTLNVSQYYTIVNGTGITFSLNTTDDTLDNEELKKIIDTVSFDELLEKPTGFSTYMLIGTTSVLVIMVIVLMFMAFSNKKDDEN